MNILIKNARVLAAIFAASGVAACTNGNGAVSPPAVSVNPGSPSYSHLQFAVGTANVAGQIDLNTVVTLRQPNGLSAVGSSTPKITWDGAFVNTGGTAAGVDAGLAQISGTLPANPAGSTVAKSTFGTKWGAFGNGFNPSNSTTGGGPSTIQQPCLPFFGANLPATANLAAGTLNCGAGAQFFGGPPAFPNVRGQALAGQLGAFLGFTPFAGITPAPGAGGTSTFTLNVALPTNPVTNLAPVNAVMSAFGGLPAFATPTLTPDGTGGGSIAYALPAGVTEAYLMVVDWGPDNTAGPSPNCNYATAGGPPYFYTIEVTPASPNPIALPDNLGASPALGSLPAGRSTHTICTDADNTAAVAINNSLNTPITNGGSAIANGSPSGADYYQVIGVGFDYPAYEAATSTSPTPAITGANGQADLTMSDISPLTLY